MTITIFLISLLIITAATLGIYMSFFEPRHDGVPIKCIVKDAILYNLLFSFRVVMPVIVIFASILVVVCVFCDRGTLGSMLKPVFATIAWFSWCFWFSWRGCRAMNHDLKVGNLASIAIWKRWAVMLISWFFAVPLSILLAKLSFDNLVKHRLEQSFLAGEIQHVHHVQENVRKYEQLFGVLSWNDKVSSETEMEFVNRLRKMDVVDEFETAKLVLCEKGLSETPLTCLKDWFLADEERLCRIFEHLRCFGGSREYCNCKTRFGRTTYREYEFIRAYGGRQLQAIYNVKRFYDIAKRDCGYATDNELENALRGVEEFVRIESVFVLLESDKWRTCVAYHKGWNLLGEYANMLQKEMTNVEKEEVVAELKRKLTQLLIEDGGRDGSNKNTVVL